MLIVGTLIWFMGESLIDHFGWKDDLKITTQLVG